MGGGRCSESLWLACVGRWRCRSLRLRRRAAAATKATPTPRAAPASTTRHDDGAGGGSRRRRGRVRARRDRRGGAGRGRAAAQGAVHRVVEEEEGGPWTFAWDFGDGGKSTEQNPSHTYDKVGEYTATLTVTDQKSNKGTDEIDIFVETDEDAQGQRRASCCSTASRRLSTGPAGRRGRRSRRGLRPDSPGALGWRRSARRGAPSARRRASGTRGRVGAGLELEPVLEPEPMGGLPQAEPAPVRARSVPARRVAPGLGPVRRPASSLVAEARVRGRGRAAAHASAPARTAPGGVARSR